MQLIPCKPEPQKTLNYEASTESFRLSDFLEEHNRNNAMSHLEIGTCELSKTVPTVTVNCPRQAPQK